MDPTKLVMNREASILSRLIDPQSANWSPAVAQGILGLDLSEADRDRMNELAAKAREGDLSPDEEMEIESYRLATGVLELMQAKARASLRREERAA